MIINLKLEMSCSEGGVVKVAKVGIVYPHDTVSVDVLDKAVSEAFLAFEKHLSNPDLPRSPLTEL